MNKEELRRELKNVLHGIKQNKRIEKSRKICENLLSTPQFKNASVLMLYLSLPYEVETRDLILSAWQHGKTVVVPRIEWEHKYMVPVAIKSLDTGFVVEKCGIRNPVKTAAVPFEQIDLVITPALGFDRKGNRLGRGSAFYDRFFANSGMFAKKCGLAFKEQIVSSIPVTGTDVPMDLIVTDEEIINLG